MTAVELAGPSAARDPAWRPRLVVLDLDGTVVPYDVFFAEPTPRVREAVDAVRAAGVPVIVATGRAVWGALPTAAALGLDGVQLVCSNGAMVYDAGAGQIRHQIMIDPAPAAFALVEAMPTAGFAVERNADGFLHTANFSADFPGAFLGEVDLATLVAGPTSRMVCRADEYTPEEAAALAAEALAGTPYSWDVGYSSWIDVMGLDVSKATGVAMVAADFGIEAADVLAIGDGTNDVELFGWVGHAVAMGQAPASVRAAAHAVTEPVDADGVAVTLSQWFR